jgi:hypothetical protein
MHTPRSLLALSVLIALATTITAQIRIYSPAPLGHHLGMNTTGYPFGYTSIKKMTYQQVHGDLPKTTLFKNLAWRPNSSTASHGKFTATLTLTFGTKGPTPDNATTTFSTNLGANPTVVIKNTQVSIGAYTKPPQPPGAFVYKLPLSQTYVYNGNGTFCWECRVHNHTAPTNLYFDLYQSQSAPTLRPGGWGCTASGATAPASLTGTISGTTINLSASNMPTAGNSMLLVGLNPTPLDLTPLGAPCSLRTDILALLPGKGTWSGTIPTTVPDGVAVYLQAGAADAKANTMGLVLSNGLCTLWPYAKRPAVRIWTTSGDTATSGSLQLLYGLVIELSL